jgi:hypothetical protein
MTISWHRWIPFHRIEDYLRLGWMILPSFDGVRMHGEYCVHGKWLCDCPPVEPLPRPRLPVIHGRVTRGAVLKDLNGGQYLIGGGGRLP